MASQRRRQQQQDGSAERRPPARPGPWPPCLEGQAREPRVPSRPAWPEPEAHGRSDGWWQSRTCRSRGKARPGWCGCCLLPLRGRGSTLSPRLQVVTGSYVAAPGLSFLIGEAWSPAFEGFSEIRPGKGMRSAVNAVGESQLSPRDNCLVVNRPTRPDSAQGRGRDSVCTTPRPEQLWAWAGCLSPFLSPSGSLCRAPGPSLSAALRASPRHLCSPVPPPPPRELPASLPFLLLTAPFPGAGTEESSAAEHRRRGASDARRPPGVGQPLCPEARLGAVQPSCLASAPRPVDALRTRAVCQALRWAPGKGPERGGKQSEAGLAPPAPPPDACVIDRTSTLRGRRFPRCGKGVLLPPVRRGGNPG